MRNRWEYIFTVIDLNNSIKVSKFYIGDSVYSSNKNGILFFKLISHKIASWNGVSITSKLAMRVFLVYNTIPLPVVVVSINISHPFRF